MAAATLTHNLHTLIDTASAEQITEALSRIADVVQSAQSFRTDISPEELRTVIDAALSTEPDELLVLLNE